MRQAIQVPNSRPAPRRIDQQAFAQLQAVDVERAP
jgi:hypothetical protein